MTSLPKILATTAMALLLAATNALCQSDELKALVHGKVDYFDYRPIPGKEFTEFKKSLEGYDKNDVANALIADLDVPRESPDNNSFRDHIVERIYAALGLPAHNVCVQLEKEESPTRKLQLMQILPESTAPEVVAALFHQTGDKRVCVEFRGVMDDGARPPGLRVCDVAFNILIKYLRKQPGGPIRFESLLEWRDDAIKKGLRKLRSDGLLKQQPRD